MNEISNKDCVEAPIQSESRYGVNKPTVPLHFVTIINDNFAGLFDLNMFQLTPYPMFQVQLTPEAHGTCLSLMCQTWHTIAHLFSISL